MPFRFVSQSATPISPGRPGDRDWVNLAECRKSWNAERSSQRTCVKRPISKFCLFYAGNYVVKIKCKANVEVLGVVFLSQNRQWHGCSSIVCHNGNFLLDPFSCQSQNRRRSCCFVGDVVNRQKSSRDRSDGHIILLQIRRRQGGKTRHFTH